MMHRSKELHRLRDGYLTFIEPFGLVDMISVSFLKKRRRRNKRSIKIPKRVIPVAPLVECIRYSLNDLLRVIF